jgi:hypothetical protein
MRYIAKCNKLVTCIYGTRQLVEGLEVPEFFARRFPQYIIRVDDTPINKQETIEESIKQNKTKKKED